jgi:hypothetical protein
MWLKCTDDVARLVTSDWVAQPSPVLLQIGGIKHQPYRGSNLVCLSNLTVCLELLERQKLGTKIALYATQTSNYEMNFLGPAELRNLEQSSPKQAHGVCTVCTCL